MYEEREGLIQPGESMQELKGKSVFGGIAIGRISVYNKDESTVKRVKIEDTAAEVKRFEEAKETAKEQLQALYEKALVEVGEVNAMRIRESMPSMRLQRQEIIFRTCSRRWTMII